MEKYQPETGRFVARDSEFYIHPGIPESLNLYTYSVSNPLNILDPTGNDCFEDSKEEREEWTKSLCWSHKLNMAILMEYLRNPYPRHKHKRPTIDRCTSACWIFRTFGKQASDLPKQKIKNINENDIEKHGDINNILDGVTSERILTLHPLIRQNAIDFILESQDQGINLRITQAYRTIEEQDKLYWQSRGENTGPWVTDAKGGRSYHNYGLAIDVVEIIDGKANWNFDTKKVAEIAIDNGFEWPLPVNDAGHFQISFGHSWQTLLDRVQNNQIEGDYVILE